jgi:hypothetical protein
LSLRPTAGDDLVTTQRHTTSIVLGPRTTVYAVMNAYPGLAAFLSDYDEAFAPVARNRDRVAWARVVTLGDVALEMNVTWRRLVRDIAVEVSRQTGHPPVTVDDPQHVAPGDPRVEQLRGIALELERGGSLVELAGRLRALTGGVDAREAESLAAVLGDLSPDDPGTGEALPRAALGGSADDRLDALPEGHPVDSLRREGVQANVLVTALRAQLDGLSPSPSRGKWRAARALVTRLVLGLDGLELRVRREREAWLAVLGPKGDAAAVALLRDRQDEALEALDLLRRALARDDAVSVLECGRLLCERSQELAVCEEQVLVPLAERNLTPGEWTAVRGLEDGVGWSLIPAPPPWPQR